MDSNKEKPKTKEHSVKRKEKRNTKMKPTHSLNDNKDIGEDDPPTFIDGRRLQRIEFSFIIVEID